MNSEHKQRTKAQPHPDARLTYPDWGGRSLTRWSKVQDCRPLWKTDNLDVAWT